MVGSVRPGVKGTFVSTWMVYQFRCIGIFIPSTEELPLSNLKEVRRILYQVSLE